MSDHTPAFPAYIDSTMRATFVQCEQRFFNQYCRRLATTSTSPDLHAGGAVAAALEAARVAFYRDGVSREAARDICFAAFTKFWGDYEPPERHNKTFTNVWAALDDYASPDGKQVGYLAKYPLDTDQVQPFVGADGNPSVEFSFAIPLPFAHPVSGEPIMYVGRFDMFGVYGGGNYCVDEKTTGRGFSYNWTEQWGLRGQFLGYCWAAKQSGFRCEGAIIRGIAILKTEIKHLQAVKAIPNFMLDRWFEQLKHDVSRMLSCWERNYFSYDFAEACSSYGGCQYMQMCSAANPDIWLGDYTERMWNPLAKDPTETKDQVT